MRAICVMAALVVALAGQAGAQDLRYSPQATANCLTKAGPSDLQSQRACVGASANACMAATMDGSTTYGMGYCLDQERGYWDARLNADYKAIRAKARALDDEMKQIGSSAPSTATALRDMQRAWIGWRDATCDFERSQWGGGTGGGPATLACLLRLTGEQALYLEQVWIAE